MAEMVKCKCGKEMEDWMTVCKECFGKGLDGKETSKNRQNSIERQVAAKCVASIFNGISPTEEQLSQTFDIMLRLIKGE